VDFLHFLASKIRVSPTGIVSSLSPPRCRLFSGQRRHTATPCHASFPLSQVEPVASASSSDNALSRRLPSRAKTEASNLYHRHRLPSANHPIPTLHCYKKIISTLATVPTTQLRLHFASFLSRAPCHHSSTHRRRSISPLSRAHHPSTQ
jgi:hypothetical protein